MGSNGAFRSYPFIVVLELLFSPELKIKLIGSLQCNQSALLRLRFYDQS